MISKRILDASIFLQRLSIVAHFRHCDRGRRDLVDEGL